MKNKNLTVSKSNNLVDASYRLNAHAQKLLLACIAQLDSRVEIPQEITMTTKEFSSLLGSSDNIRRDLYTAADSLFDSVITIKNDNEIYRIRWVQKDVKKHKGDGAVTLFWSNDVLQYISQLKSRFTTYKLKNISLLQSSHSIRLYELLMRFKSTGERIITLNDFKSALGISDKYPVFKELNRRVLKPSLDELNKKSNLSVKCETIKNRRSVSSLFFEFKTKNK